MIPTILRRVKLAKVYAKSYFLCAIIFSYIFFPTIVVAQTAPYPASEYKITFDFSTQFTKGQGSDQWPMTWANDGNVFGAFGDGLGWDNLGQNYYMGVTRIQGSPPGLSGSDISGVQYPGSLNFKGSGIIADSGNKMYLFTARSTDHWESSTPGVSTNNGQTWSWSTTKVFSLSNDGVVVVGIAQFGPGYTGIPSNVDSRYFYVYLSNNSMNESPQSSPRGQNVYLGRVLKANIFNRGSYQFFNGLDGNNNPTWSTSSKVPVLSDPAGMGFHAMVTYNPGIGRYIFAKSDRVSGLGVFESTSPWGPWKTIYYTNTFKDSFWKFTFQFPQKWMSNAGKTMWMTWSGWPQYDSVTFVEAKLELTQQQPPADMTAPARPEGLNIQ